MVATGGSCSLGTVVVGTLDKTALASCAPTLELDTGTCSGAKRVTWIDCEAPRKRFGLENLLLTRTVGAGLGWRRPPVASKLGGSAGALVAPPAAAAANELMAEARMPNWPVRVTTTNLGFVDLVGVLAGTELVDAGGGSLGPGSWLAVDLSWGLASLDLGGRRKAAPGGATDSAPLDDWAAGELVKRFGWSVCIEGDRNRLEATRERS